MNILITGRPGCGKTSLIKEILPNLNNVFGFYTEEVKEEERRVGFLLKTIRGQKVAPLAHINIKSQRRVSRYGVDVETFEKIVIPEIKEGIREKDAIILIDEIGKMELFSKKFKEVVLASLSCARVLGTISLKGDSFIEAIKQKSDTIIYRLSRQGYERAKGKIMSLLLKRDGLE